MQAKDSPIVVIVRPGRSPRRAAEVIRWVRWLLPAAFLVVGTPAAARFARDAEVVTLDVDEIASGPLSLADALAKARHG